MTVESSHDATPYVPEQADLTGLARAAAGCRGCPLYAEATQTVFGEGPADARMVLVGEAPGDQEDRRGRPFVGPAGRLLDRALEEAGIARGDVYLTNAVKHFAFTVPAGGRRRLHKTPSARQTSACRPWLLAELHVIDPKVVVLLGAVAGKALLGSRFRITPRRGELLPCPPPEMLGTPQAARFVESADPADAPARLLATVHPSAVLRADDREGAYAGLVEDLRAAAGALDR
ncbi:UdgX family uracil-DNA binding protein [Thermomonospora catenispora]|uniref:UdgX family uracil-DNA binding protein n=1 Tax=Thermomonospora catenispora TaxID=2493090 RepID=UPI0011209A38|nr:UdgX family uracil-DNA binding protein [Thermomonospora catenispora]TNY35620.1 uracil-DNA glycosylase [Thermomonospora catenispora]